MSIGEKYKKNLGIAICSELILFLVIFGVSQLFASRYDYFKDSSFGKMGSMTELNFILLSLLGMFFIAPFLLCNHLLYLEIVRKDKVSLKNVFQGFRHIVSSIGVYFCGWVYLVGCCLPCIVLDVIAKYKKIDILILFAVLFLFLGFFYFLLNFSLGYFVLADNPKLKGFEVLEKSSLISLGHKMELFSLFSSFVLPLYIAMFFFCYCDIFGFLNVFDNIVTFFFCASFCGFYYIFVLYSVFQHFCSLFLR